VRRVLIAGRTRAPLFDGAYPINRLLLARLLSDERAGYVCEPASWCEEGTIRVSSADKSVSDVFDHAIVRHGITRSLEQEFPEVSRAVAARMKTWGELRLTRRPLWSSPPALAIEHQGAGTDIESERPRLSSCYSDILDPWVQFHFRRVMADDAQFMAFYTGRLRLLALLHSDVIINAAQFLDGCFFHLLLEDG